MSKKERLAYIAEMESDSEEEEEEVMEDDAPSPGLQPTYAGEDKDPVQADSGFFVKPSVVCMRQDVRTDGSLEVSVFA